MEIINPALLICDLQFDFCAKSGFAAKIGRDISPIQEIIPKLKRFYQAFRKTEQPIFFTQYVARKDLSPTNVRINQDRRERARLCLINSQGARLYSIKPKPDDVVIQKKYFDSFAQTELKSRLIRKRIQTLIICGVRTELSVDATAKRGVAEGFSVIIARDLIGTYKGNQNNEKHFLRVFNRYYGHVLKTEEILTLLELD